MHAEDGGNVSECAFLDVVAGLGADLFCHLEKELHGAVDLFPMLGQDLRRAKEHGGVTVVAAGVHDACIPGGVGLCEVGFLNGEGIDIGTKGDGLAGVFPMDDTDAAGDVVPGEDLVDSHLLKFGHDVLRGIHLMISQLGMGVEIAALAHDVVFFCECQCFRVDHAFSPFRKSVAN